tara:strand:+ start:199 stop:375 length:177 start_codon:yes stop_codon:yes gene_type:complete
MREINSALYKLELLYLDYLNNFLTVEKFAEFYGMSTNKALKLIKIGKEINNENLKGGI